jgi:hypothetical protein
MPEYSGRSAGRCWPVFGDFSNLMSDPRIQMPPKQTLFLILLPMLATFACQRLCLHVGGVRHVYPGGYLVHHLFFGVLIVMPAAFLLAFGTRRRWLAIATRVALGTGSAMILDEIVYLIATKATDDDYISGISLWGGVVFISLGVILLWIIYMSCGETEPTRLSPGDDTDSGGRS